MCILASNSLSEQFLAQQVTRVTRPSSPSSPLPHPTTTTTRPPDDPTPSHSCPLPFVDFHMKSQEDVATMADPDLMVVFGTSFAIHFAKPVIFKRTVCSSCVAVDALLGLQVACVIAWAPWHGSLDFLHFCPSKHRQWQNEAQIFEFLSPDKETSSFFDGSSS